MASSREEIFQLAAKLVRQRSERDNTRRRLKRQDAEMALTINELRRALQENDRSDSRLDFDLEDVDAVVITDPDDDHLHGLIPEGQSFTKSPVRNRIISFFETKGDGKVSTEEIGKAVGLSADKQRLYWTLSHLKRKGFIERLGRGSWKFNKNALREDAEREQSSTDDPF